MPKIYTKAGDYGISSLYDNSKKTKSSLIFHTLGNLDELNSYIGVIISVLGKQNHIQIGDKSIHYILTSIQNNILKLSSSIATPGGLNFDITRFEPHEFEIILIEKYIDIMDLSLKPLRVFILPGNNQNVISSHIHVGRVICRRAERFVCEYNELYIGEDCILVYLNRLSDFFFTLARFIDENGESCTSKSWYKFLTFFYNAV